jgi:hypothetical protein
MSDFEIEDYDDYGDEEDAFDEEVDEEDGVTKSKKRSLSPSGSDEIHEISPPPNKKAMLLSESEIEKLTPKKLWNYHVEILSEKFGGKEGKLIKSEWWRDVS